MDVNAFAEDLKALLLRHGIKSIQPASPEMEMSINTEKQLVLKHCNVTTINQPPKDIRITSQSVTLTPEAFQKVKENGMLKGGLLHERDRIGKIDSFL